MSLEFSAVVLDLTGILLYTNFVSLLSVPGRARADRQEADRALNEGPADAAKYDLGVPDVDWETAE